MGIIQRQGIRNSIITYIGILLGAVSLIFIQPRFLTKEEIGLTRLLFSFSALIAVVMPMGMNAATLKFFPYFRNREERHQGFFGFMLLFPAVGFIVISTLLFLCSDYILKDYAQSPLFVEYFYYVFPMTFSLTFISVLTAYSYSIFRTSVPAFLSDIIVRIGSILLFTIYFIKVINRDQFIFLFVAIYGTQLLTLVIYLFFEDRPSIKIKWEKYEEHSPWKIFRYGLLMSLSGISALGLKYLDTIMLGMYKPKETSLHALDLVGIYSIAAFVATFVEAPMNALDKIIVPKIADGWKNNDTADIQQIYYKSAKYLFLLGGFLFLLINLNIDSLFSLIPDHDYSLAKGVVFIISFGTLLNMATGSNDGILYTSERYIILTWLLLGLLAIAYINYKIFIPLFGMEGAAIATALSATIFNTAKFFLIKRFFGLQPFTMATIKIALVILITGLVVYFIPKVPYVLLDIVLRTSLITIVFGLLVYQLKILEEFHHLIPYIGKSSSED